MTIFPPLSAGRMIILGLLLKEKRMEASWGEMLTELGGARKWLEDIEDKRLELHSMREGGVFLIGGREEEGRERGFLEGGLEGPK